MAIELLCQIWKILKIEKNNNIFFQNIPEHFSIFKKTKICIRTLPDEYVYKISSGYLKKRLSFAILNAQKGHFLRYFRGFRHFSDFQFLSGTFALSFLYCAECFVFRNLMEMKMIFVRFRRFKKCSRVIFRVTDEYLTQKYISRHPS